MNNENDYLSKFIDSVKLAKEIAAENEILVNSITLNDKFKIVKSFPHLYGEDINDKNNVIIVPDMILGFKTYIDKIPLDADFMLTWRRDAFTQQGIIKQLKEENKKLRQKINKLLNILNDDNNNDNNEEEE